MNEEGTRELSDFWVAGINYRKTDATIRGQFAINADQYSALLAEAGNNGLRELFVLSTCNRTEIYGLASDVHQLTDLLCSYTVGSRETFSELAYIKNGTNAIDHLLHVSAGLDSQVLGDYEIVGQMKTAAKFAKSQGYMGSFMERLVNNALQSSKSVKNNTSISGGTVSVSFAAIQYIREHVTDYKKKNILLLGTGKIGRNTCRNLVDYLGTRNITLINRTFAKAHNLATELGLECAHMEETRKHIQRADIIITATNATGPVITCADVKGFGPKLLIDLSVPNNVEISVKDLDGIRLMNVDELSSLKDETLQMREAEVPKAKEIIREHISEFMDWYTMRQNVPMLKAIKQKLEQSGHCPLAFTVTNSWGKTVDTNEKIQKVVNTAAIRMKTHKIGGCHYIEAMNHYFSN